MLKHKIDVKESQEYVTNLLEYIDRKEEELELEWGESMYQEVQEYMHDEISPYSDPNHVLYQG